MADFMTAATRTLIAEGGYANHELDMGKETYKGISRRFHPTWPGWVLIDEAKLSKNFPKSLDQGKIGSDLQALVLDFYEEEFWDVSRLDEVKSQKIANEMYDTGVNANPRRSVKYVQRSLNLVRHYLRERYSGDRGSIFNALAVDGAIGMKTLTALNSVTSHFKEEKFLLLLMDHFQLVHYVDRVEELPNQGVFLKGWILNRIGNEIDGG